MPRRVTSSSRTSRLGLALLVLSVFFGGLSLVAPAHAANLDALTGTGTEADPYLVDSAAGLDALTAAVNSDPATYGSSHIKLARNIDYQGGTFAGIQRFSGVFDGGGHIIANAVLDSHVDGTVQRVAFFGTLQDATVRDLTLAGLTARLTGSVAQGATEVAASGLATTATSSHIEGVTLRDITVRNEIAAGTQYISGLVGRVTGTATEPSTITDNAVLGSHTVSTVTKYSGAFLGYQGAYTTVSRNLVAADPDGYMSQNGAGGANMNSSVLVNYVGASMQGQEIADNVVLSGSIYSHATGTTGNTVSWIAGFNHGQVDVYGTNLVNSDHNRAGFPAVAESDVTGHPLRWTRRAGTAYQHDAVGGALWVLGNDGTPATPAELGARTTYESLGWDFESIWRWDAASERPVLRSAPVLTAAQVSAVLQAGAAKTPAEILDLFGITADRGTPTVDLTGVDFGVVGTYPIVVTVTDGALSDTLTVQLVVQSTTSTRPVISVESDTTSYQVGASPTAAELLERFGAEVDRGELGIDLSGVDFATIGRYPASVTATDGTDEALPVPVTIEVGALAGLGTQASPYLLDTTAALDAAVAQVNADTAQSAAAKAHYRVTADLDYAGRPFTTFRRFSGVLDGDGHTLSNLTLTPGTETDPSDAGSTQTGLVQILNGTVRDLTLVGLASVTAGDSSARVQQGALAGRIAGARITGTALVDAVVRSSANTDNSSAVGGLVGKSVGADNLLADNLLAGVTVSGDKRVGGVIGWQNSAAEISRHLVLDTSVTQNGSSGAGAGLIVGHTVFAGNVTGNVVLSGRIAQAGPANYGWIRSAVGGTASNNLVNANNNIDPDEPVGHTSAPNPNPYDVFWSGSSTLDTAGQWTPADLGTYATPEQLASRATYEDLGWDLAERWVWDAVRKHPLPAGVDLPSVPVALDLAGGTDDGANATEQGFATTTRLVNPTRAGYEFAGWTGDTLTGASKSVTLPRYPAGALAYTATWTPTSYPIGYTLAGGTATGNPTTYTIESPALTLVAPTRSGYTFAGWTGTGLTGASASVSVPSGSTGERSYTATWTPDDYRIGYDLAGGTASGANPTSYGIESPAFTLTNPTRTGYAFAGWSGTGITGVSNSVTVPASSTGTREYTATWTPVTYHLVYALGEDADFTQEAPGTYTIESRAITLPTPVRPGYVFAGWTGTGLGGPTTTVVVPTGSTGTREYTPTWRIRSYTIGYRLGGGRLATANPTSYTVASAPFTMVNPTRPDHVFAGWSGLGTTSRTLTVPTGTTRDLTLTATWTKRAKTKPAVSVTYVKKPRGRKSPTKVRVSVRTVSGYSAATGRVKVTLTRTVRVGGRPTTVTRTARATLRDGVATLRIPTRGLSRGRYRITATFAGSTFYKKATSTAVSFNYKK